jgi:hypothetical protein
LIIACPNTHFGAGIIWGGKTMNQKKILVFLRGIAEYKRSKLKTYFV